MQPLCSRNAPLSSFTAFRNISQYPPLQALRATTALPSGLLGPVDCCHGFHCLIASLCCLRRSSVHPFAGLLMIRLQ